MSLSPRHLKGLDRPSFAILAFFVAITLFFCGYSLVLSVRSRRFSGLISAREDRNRHRYFAKSPIVGKSLAAKSGH